MFSFLFFPSKWRGVKGAPAAPVLRRFRPGLDYERSATSGAQLDAVLSFETTAPRRKRRLRLLGGAECYAEQDAGERTAEAAGLLAGANGVPCAPEVLLRRCS